MGLTRKTVGGIQPDLKDQALSDILHWVWSWRAQKQRLVSSTDAQGKGGTKLEIRRSFSLASYDEHMLVVVGWNLARAIAQADKFFPSFHIAEEQIEAIRLLRHLYEHWDEQRESFQNSSVQKKRSSKKFVERFPNCRPWSITYTKDDWLIGGIVGIQAITDALVSIENTALEIEKQLSKK